MDQVEMGGGHRFAGKSWRWWKAVSLSKKQSAQIRFGRMSICSSSTVPQGLTTERRLFAPPMWSGVIRFGLVPQSGVYGSDRTQGATVVAANSQCLPQIDLSAIVFVPQSSLS